MKSKDTYIRIIEEQLKEWKKELDTLTARADKVEAQARTEYHQKLDNLKEKQAAAEVNLKDLKEASKESWEDLKKGYENIREDMKKSIENVQTSIT